MNILLLGGTGFIGQAVAEKLVEAGNTVSLLTHANLPASLLPLQDQLKLFPGDVLDKSTLTAAFQTQDIVINLVGQSTSDQTLFQELNLTGGQNVLDVCLTSGIKNIMLISSCMVYGESGETASVESDVPEPQTNYARVKLETETLYTNFATGNNLNLTVLRLANVYGPNGTRGVIPAFVVELQNESELTLSDDGTQTRDFIYIDDVASSIARITKNFPTGLELFNISTGEQTSLLDLVSLLEDALSKTATVTFAPSTEPTEARIFADNTKAKEAFQLLTPISLPEGLKQKINKDKEPGESLHD